MSREGVFMLEHARIRAFKDQEILAERNMLRIEVEKLPVIEE